MSFEEPINPRSCQIVNNQIQLTELATYEEWAPVHDSMSDKEIKEAFSCVFLYVFEKPENDKRRIKRIFSKLLLH